jgi:hypothetical protein
MTKRLWLAMVICAVMAASVWANATDVSGTWKASFDTQIGQQNYTYEFSVKDSVLTGKAKSDNGETAITDGKVDGDKVTFVEMLTFQGMEIRIVYTGTVKSADEIQFTRQVADFATEELKATRVKDPSAK